MFTCKKCGGPASVADGIISRACGHDDAGVLAGLKAHATGTGGVVNRSLMLREKFLKGLDKVVDNVRKQRGT